MDADPETGADSGRPFRCFGCDAPLTARTSYCPHCGVRLDSGVTTPAWPGAEPDANVYVRERPRLIGVPPQDTTLVLGVLLVGAGVALLAVGIGVTGAVVLAGGAAFLAVFVEAVRRRPGSVLLHTFATWAGVLLAQLRFAGSATSTRLATWTESVRLEREARRLRRPRRDHLLALGDAVYRDDAESAETARDALRALDARLAATTSEASRLRRRAAVRLRAARVTRRRQSAQARDRGPAGPVGAR